MAKQGCVLLEWVGRGRAGVERGSCRGQEKSNGGTFSRTVQSLLHAVMSAVHGPHALQGAGDGGVQLDLLGPFLTAPPHFQGLHNPTTIAVSIQHLSSVDLGV